MQLLLVGGAASRLTPAALHYAEPDSLRHKLIVVPDLNALDPAVRTALHVLGSRGALSVAQVGRHPHGGRGGTSVVEVRGPVALITGAPAQRKGGRGDPDERCLAIPIDESPTATARLLAAERRRLALSPERVAAERRVARERLHRLQRLVRPGPVTVPFAERVVFPATTVQHRRDQRMFFGLIAASAILHQHQRLSTGGAVIADRRDFAVAVRVADALGLGCARDLSTPAMQVLKLLWQMKRTTVSMIDLAEMLPHWTRWTCRAALTELEALDFIVSSRSGKGRLRSYELVTTPTGPGMATGPARIRLLDEGVTPEEVGVMAAVGGEGPPSVTPGVAVC